MSHTEVFKGILGFSSWSWKICPRTKRSTLFHNSRTSSHVLFKVLSYFWPNIFPSGKMEENPISSQTLYTSFLQHYTCGLGTCLHDGAKLQCHRTQGGIGTKMQKNSVCTEKRRRTFTVRATSDLHNGNSEVPLESLTPDPAAPRLVLQQVIPTSPSPTITVPRRRREWPCLPAEKPSEISFSIVS